MTVSRDFWVIVHRWAGLTIALFLVVAGVTGAVLPWEESLTLASRADLSRVTPLRTAPLDGVTLAERIGAQIGGKVAYVPLDIPRTHVLQVDVVANVGRPALPYDTVWADPYTGRVRLAYRSGVLADGVQNIVPFLYLLHSSLAAGAWGRLALGIAALVWTLDCFVGLYLTLPVSRGHAAATRSARLRWWSRWRPAWTVRKRARGYKLHFDLHRAGGLWLWPMLLVFAWSSVGFNLPVVHRPVMAMLGASRDFTPPTLPRAMEVPPIGLREARRIGRDLMQTEAIRHGLKFEREGDLSYDPIYGLYSYSAHTNDDPPDDADTLVSFDARSGRLVSFQGPLGEHTTDAIMTLFYRLHRARIGGVTYRVFVSLLGMAVAMLSVTGVFIWTRKRSARLARRERNRTPLPRPAHAAAE